MAAKSPAKPWETNTMNSPIDSTTNNAIIPPTPITKHANNPHINRSGSSTNSSPPTDINASNNNTQQSTTPQQQPQQQMMSPSYNAYDNSMYGNSMYGNGMYGNSMYGGMGGMYGNSMYGGMGGMGGMGYGMNGMYGGMGAPMGPMGPMGFMQMSVNNVGRFSQLLQVASQALHMTFSSLVQFAGNIGMLAREFGGFLSGVYIFRFLKWLYLKIKKFLFWIIGKKPSTKEQFEEMFKNAVDATTEKAQTNDANTSTHYSWLSIGFYCFGILYVIQWIYKSISNELNQQKKLQQQQMQMQQQQMMNPMNTYQQNLAFAQNNPYGYYQPGYNNMYPQQQMNMMQQQQQQTNNNNNNNNESKQSNDKNKQSESLLAKPKEETVNV